MKTGTVALIVRVDDPKQKPTILETISDDQEIKWVETKITEPNTELLKELKELRAVRTSEEEQFGDYVEGLLSQPFLPPEVRTHGVRWMHSKIKIDKFKSSEAEAAKVIADFALRVFVEDPHCEDFYLMGPSARVRVRIFKVEEAKKQAA